MQSEVASGRVGVVQAADEIDLRALGGALWRKRRMIIALTLAAAAIAFVAVNAVTSRYRSEARVLIETRDNIFPDAEKSLERSSTVDQEAVTSQVQLILSRDLAREIIKKLKLAERPEFDPVLRRPGTLHTILRVVGFTKDPLQMTPEERVLKSYYERLAAFQVEKSRVIAIEFESEDSDLAAQAANAVAEGYLVLQQATKQDQTRSAGTWLPRDHILRGKVADAEAKVEQQRPRATCWSVPTTRPLHQQLGDQRPTSAAAQPAKGASSATRCAPARLANSPTSPIPSSCGGCPSSASRCARSLPSNPRPCSTSTRASRNCARRLPISSGRSAARPNGSPAHSSATPTPASRRSAPASTSSSTRRLPPTSRTCSCAPSIAIPSRSATCRNPIWPNTARRPRAIPSGPRPPTPASSRGPGVDHATWLKKLPTALASALPCSCSPAASATGSCWAVARSVAVEAAALEVDPNTPRMAMPRLTTPVWPQR